MLTITNIFSSLKLQLFRNYRLKNSLFILYPFTYSFGLTRYCLYGTHIEENKRFPLHEINNIKLPLLNYDEEKLSLIVKEILQAISKRKNLPEFIKLSDIVDLLEFESVRQRSKYLTYLFKKEKMKINDAEKILKKRSEQVKKNMTSLTDSSHIQYGLGKNTLLLNTWKRSVIKFYEKRLANCVLFGQKIVIDLSYDKYMWQREKKACATQLRLLFSLNRYNPEPYDLYFCNADPESRCVQYINREIPNVNQSLTTLCEQSYLDLFPKKNLVYLSPHAADTLKTYDHKAIYIIGGFVDLIKKDHISLEKAEREGIKSYSLPLNDYVLWGLGGKSLSINQVFSIMQTMRDTGNWIEAFKHIPTRKLKRIQKNSEATQLISDKLFVLSD